MINPLGSVNFLMKWSCWGHWGHWGCWNHWGHWDCRGFKAWKITTEDFRVIQAKEVRCPCPGIWIQHYFYVLRKNFFGWNHEISYWILAPFLSEAVEASQYYFFENWFIKLKCPTLLKPLATVIQQNYWSFYPSEPFTFTRYTMRHPVL